MQEYFYRDSPKIKKKKMENQKETMLLIQTDLGNIKIKLYNETPQHRDNFIKLAQKGFFDGTLFHRVIKDFMIQGGDPDSKNAPKGKSLGSGDAGYTIPAEFVYPQLFHKKGALSAARQSDEVNPKKGFQWLPVLHRYRKSLFYRSDSEHGTTDESR